MPTPQTDAVLRALFQGNKTRRELYNVIGEYVSPQEAVYKYKAAYSSNLRRNGARKPGPKRGMTILSGQIRVGTKAIAAAVLNNLVVHGDIINDEGDIFTITRKGTLKRMNHGLYAGPAFYARQLVRAIEASEINIGTANDNPIYGKLSRLLRDTRHGS